MVLIGVGLVWAGLLGLLPELGFAGPPVRTLVLVAAASGLVVGVWMCWHGLARHVRPPEAASQVVDVVGVAMLLGLALAAGVLSVADFGIS